jgi:hypothetical protein
LQSVSPLYYFIVGSFLYSSDFPKSCSQPERHVKYDPGLPSNLRSVLIQRFCLDITCSPLVPYPTASCFCSSFCSLVFLLRVSLLSIVLTRPQVINSSVFPFPFRLTSRRLDLQYSNVHLYTLTLSRII